MKWNDKQGLSYVLMTAAALIGVALFAQPVFAQGETSVAQNLTAVIGAAVALVTAVAGIITAVMGYLKNRGLIREGDNRVVDTLFHGADYIYGNDIWNLELQGQLTTVIEVVTALSPETKKALEDKGLDMQKLTADLNATTAEIKRLHPLIPQ